MKSIILMTIVICLCLFSPVQFSLAQSIEPPEAGVRVVLVKISSYTEFKEIRDEILKISSVNSVVTRSSAQGLITLDVGYAGPSDSLAHALQTAFDGRYTVTPKKLASGMVEINLSPRG